MREDRIMVIVAVVQGENSEALAKWKEEEIAVETKS
jgi:hypothetical protein